MRDRSDGDSSLLIGLTLPGARGPCGRRGVLGGEGIGGCRKKFLAKILGQVTFTRECTETCVIPLY